jgi:DNA polymerase-3 subunit alpha
MFVHLRLHTEFSVVDGTNRIDEVVKAAAADGQPALAITDLNNLFGAIKFYKEARGKGVKPVIGAEADAAGPGQGARRAHARACCWCRTTEGYLNLCELLARAWTQQRGARAGGLQARMAARSWREGLIAAVGRAGRAAGPGRCCRATRARAPSWR